MSEIEVQMAKLERMTNDLTTKRCRSLILDLWFRNSFVIRHLCFVIILAFGVGTAFAQKRNITEKDLFDFVWIGVKRLIN